MDHNDALALLPAYLDKELGVADAMRIEQHLGQCPICQAELAQQASVSARIREEGVAFRAPADLAQRIRARLPREATSPTRRGFLEWMRDFVGPGGMRPGWYAGGALAASLVALVWSASLFLARPSGQELLARELISSHVRSLQVDHLSDVASTDKHTVKPWFQGKLDFSPAVVDLAAQEFPLEGGRLDYVGGRTVAVLVYRHRKHPINLYIWPGTDADATPQVQDRQGFHLVRWTAGGMNYWAVSDLAMGELEDFVEAFRAKA